MKTYKHVLIITLLTAFLAAFSPLSNASTGQACGSIGDKALRGFTNIPTSVLEMPKNIINTTNNSTNVFYGIFGGFLKGILHTTARVSAGLLDLLTFPLQTKPITDPIYPWQEYFERDTTYGPIFDLNCAQQQAPAPMPIYQTVVPVEPQVVSPKADAVDHTDQYREETDRNLNRLFKKEMQK
jgi:putative exosortase-associated protein (TIGR04073 family)